jgi:hypothetical protein
MIGSPITDKHDREMNIRIKRKKEHSVLSAERQCRDNFSGIYMTKAHLFFGIYSK